MKKKIITALLLFSLSLSVFTGCGPVDREAQESYKQLGIVKLQEGEYSSAIENFQKALKESLGKIGEKEIDICYYKALAQFKAGQVLAAVETYSALLEYDEKNADTYFLRGSVYLQCKETSSDEEKQAEYQQLALADYDRAIALDAQNYERYLQIYENLMAMDLDTYAETYLTKALELPCESGEDYCAQGYMYMMLEEYDKAASMLEVAIDKACDEAILYQAQLARITGDEDTAKSLLNTYIAKYPEDVEALYEAGLLFISTGAYAEAQQILEQAYALVEEGTHQDLLKNLIYTCEYAGDFSRAYELMSVYVQVYPSDAEAAREYAFLETRTGTSQTPEERAQEEAVVLDDANPA